ncbi:ATP-dependent helicase HrpB [Streptomyces sp. NPDC005438]|uniref:ATP-dependent helicase HrpB n=1 Tax=Streptomyces sp. NPDC005438 TaxID=3156880 RepID=UPI0033A9E906
MPLTDPLRALPVHGVLPELAEALRQRGTAVLQAPPGTGKTTLVPLAMAGLVPSLPGAGDRPRRVLVAEPRRMAARSAAARMAWLLGEEGPGHSVGFTVRGERRVGPATRVEVVTTGVLLQRLHRDEELGGVDAVLVDECHERHLDADTALAFLLDVRATLRPELSLVATSATQDSDSWARLLAEPGQPPAPVVRSEVAGHPVETRYAPPPSSVRPPLGTRVDPEMLRHVAATVRRALREEERGDLLCFLPGVGEIARVAGLLGDLDVEVTQLHGRASPDQQRRVLAGSDGDRRRVVLATAVAESSLTVPGVRIVVDSGLAREPRTDHARGLGALTTVTASQATATQRAGRAGRQWPGVAYRCWSATEEALRPRWPAPEIQVAELSDFALRAASWGDPGAERLALLDAPPAGALAAARRVLRALGAVDEEGRVTDRGARLAGLGLPPRLARAALDGARRLGVGPAAELVALLSEEPPRGYGDDLAEAWRTARRGGDGYAARWRSEARRLRRALAEPARDAEVSAAPSDEEAAGWVAALAFPERVARASGGRDFLMASGTRAEVSANSPLREADWLAVAVADRPVGASSARVALAAPITGETAREAASTLWSRRDEVGWDPGRGDVVARSVDRLGAIEWSVRPLSRPDPALVTAAVREGLEREGLDLLRWGPAARSLRERLAFLHRELGDPWPPVDDAALLERLAEWLPPGVGSRADLGRVDALSLLNTLMPWRSGVAGRLDELAPERLELPSGTRTRLDYSGERPVLAARVQHLFGLWETPRIADGRVPLRVELLSPAGRPAAVTSDLATFWREGYPAVRSDLRGRYPKHAWPLDPRDPTRTR